MTPFLGLIALRPNAYERAFPPYNANDDLCSESDEEEKKQKQKKDAKVKEICIARVKKDDKQFEEATAIVAKELRFLSVLVLVSEMFKRFGRLCADDLSYFGSRRDDEFCGVLLWAHGRAFDGKLKEDPQIVTLARKGDMQGVISLLAAGCNIESCSGWSFDGMVYDNDTALTAAARHGHVELVQFLIDCGADPNHTFFEKEEFFKSLQEAAAKELQKLKEEEERLKRQEEEEQKSKKQKGGKNPKKGGKEAADKSKKGGKKESKKDETPAAADCMLFFWLLWFQLTSFSSVGFRDSFGLFFQASSVCGRSYGSRRRCRTKRTCRVHGSEISGKEWKSCRCGAVAKAHKVKDGFLHSFCHENRCPTTCSYGSRQQLVAWSFLRPSLCCHIQVMQLVITKLAQNIAQLRLLFS